MVKLVTEIEASFFATGLFGWTPQCMIYASLKAQFCSI